MNLGRVISVVRENGIRQSLYLAGVKLHKREAEEVSYVQWQKCSSLSAARKRRMAQRQFEHAPLFGVSACMDEGARAAFLSSLGRQIYRRFRALKNCPDAEYILAVDGEVTLCEELLWECAAVLSERKGAGPELIYFDSDLVGEDGAGSCPAFRPDYDPDLLQSVNYMGNVVLVRADLAHGAGLLAGGSAVSGQDCFHRFLKNVCFRDKKAEGAGLQAVYHIPKVLYHRRAAVPGSMTLRDHDGSGGPCSKREPLISVLIPNKDHAKDLKRCVESLLTVNTWKNLEILILENNSEEAETFALYRRLEERDSRIRILTWDKPFNYSAINNFGASSAKGEYLLFLNNDTAIVEAESIRSMQRLSERAEVGAVGALLLYPDGRVQHAGIILGYGGIAGHAWEGERPEDITDPFPRMVYAHTHNVSAVTGACMMVRGEVFAAVGGMDETLEVTFNDVDLCMKLRKEGLRILMCPEACLLHDESASRGSEDSPQKVARFHREIRTFVHRWERELEKGDPFYNPNLTLTFRSWTCRDIKREARKPYVKYLHI